jgi:hypothetical protein
MTIISTFMKENRHWLPAIFCGSLLVILDLWLLFLALTVVDSRGDPDRFGAFMWVFIHTIGLIVCLIQSIIHGMEISDKKKRGY